jgi:hypothetical protein
MSAGRPGRRILQQTNLLEEGKKRLMHNAMQMQNKQS